MSIEEEPTDAHEQPAAERLRRLCRLIGEPAFTASDYRVGRVTHIVLLRFAAAVPAAERAGAVQAFLSLKDDCQRQGVPYIRSIEHGTQQSGEDATGGFEHAFIMTFASEGDRNYYVGEPLVNDPACHDPAHHAFKAMIGAKLAPGGVVVFDYYSAELA